MAATVTTGLAASVDRFVSPDDTAAAVGSGDLQVLATPVLLAWAESATCDAVADHLEASRTTVGTRVQIEHLRPSPVGARIRVRASVVHVDGRLLRFEVTAEHTDGTVVGHGEITRVVVDRDRFLSRL
jgi:fluoroacetyl-CoA thioesterase